MSGQDTRTGTAAVVAAAVAEAEPAIEQAEQLSLLDDPSPGQPAACADDRQGPGRRKGAMNKRTREMAEFLGANWRHPLVTLAMLQAENPLTLAKRLNCKPVEALGVIKSAAAELAPYMASKMPVGVVVNTEMPGFSFVSPEAALAVWAAKAGADGAIIDAPDFHHLPEPSSAASGTGETVQPDGDMMTKGDDL